MFSTKSNSHKYIIFSSPIRVRRMGEVGWGSNKRPAKQGGFLILIIAFRHMALNHACFLAFNPGPLGVHTTSRNPSLFCSMLQERAR